MTITLLRTMAGLAILAFMSSLYALCKKLILFCYLVFLLPVSSGAQMLQWARALGGNSSAQPNAVVNDAFDGVYTGGRFTGTFDMDPGAGVANITSVGAFDSYISKLDASGNFAWGAHLAGNDLQELTALDIDPSGNIIAVGWFGGTVDFDPGPGIFNMTALLTFNPYILKLDASGNFIWAKQLGPVTYIRDVKTNTAGDIILTGTFSADSVDLDPGPGFFSLPNFDNTPDIFVLKLNSSGDYVWAKGMGGIGLDMSYALAIDKVGNIYTAASSSHPIDFDPGPNVVQLIPSGKDVFISKLNAQGDYVWAIGIGGPGDQSIYDLVLDTLGQPIISGLFAGAMDCDPSAASFNLTSSGQTSTFLAAYDTVGHLQWATTGGGYSLAVDGSNNLYSTGGFGGSMDFDPGPNNNVRVAVGEGDAYVVKYRAVDGTLVWAHSAGGKLIDRGIEIAASTSGDAYIAGEFYSDSLIAGPFTIINSLPTYVNPFILKYSVGPSSITTAINDVGVTIFPNPASGTINISSQQAMDKIIVTDVTGRVVTMATPAKANATVTIGTPGMYFVTVIAGGCKLTKKLLIER